MRASDLSEWLQACLNISVKKSSGARRSRAEFKAVRSFTMSKGIVKRKIGIEGSVSNNRSVCLGGPSSERAFNKDSGRVEVRGEGQGELEERFSARAQG